jgi:hypothetical protein
MLDIFESVEPVPPNLDVYGHKIRKLLLLAAMEAEASWAAILKANSYPPPKGRLSTTDYVKLLKPMLLDGYSLELTSYPGFQGFAPFRDWDPSCPTQSLHWYDAYNATKHNREENLKEATLEKAIHAVGAAVVMFYVSLGPVLFQATKVFPSLGVFSKRSSTRRGILTASISLGLVPAGIRSCGTGHCLTVLSTLERGP